MLTLITTAARPFDYGTQEFIDIQLDGQTIGKINLLQYESGERHVDRIDIDEAFQGQGFGTQVLQNFSGAYVVPDNADAARLYARIGSEVRANDEFSYLDEGFGVYTID